jgi:hypothetical protein
MGTPTVYNRWYFVVDRVKTNKALVVGKNPHANFATKSLMNTTRKIKWKERIVTGRIMKPTESKDLYLSQVFFVLHCYTDGIRRRSLNKHGGIVWKVIFTSVSFTLSH